MKCDLINLSEGGVQEILHFDYWIKRQIIGSEMPLHIMYILLFHIQNGFFVNLNFVLQIVRHWYQPLVWFTHNESWQAILRPTSVLLYLPQGLMKWGKNSILPRKAQISEHFGPCWIKFWHVWMRYKQHVESFACNTKDKTLFGPYNFIWFVWCQTYHLASCNISLSLLQKSHFAQVLWYR